MTFTYTLTTAVGQVRLLIPDTDSTAYELTDEEITQFLAWRGNVVTAGAVMACEHLARKYAKRVSFTDGPLSVQNSQRAEVFAARAKELAAQIGGAASSVELTRSDGYSEATTDSDYQASTVYIRV